MHCPTCQSTNPSGANFCLACGTRLSPPTEEGCPHCGADLPPEARYCVTCGHNLSQPLAATQARLEQYIPRALLDKLETARSAGAMSGERRVVTMLFCDIKGSTAMAETLDPEEWADIMNGAFEYLIAPVYRYEGTLARLMGDAILAFFGAPIAHEDDPERAVRAGLEIVAGIQPYREQVKREWGMDFDVRVGINTGLVVVGEVGSDLRVEYTAMGDAINLAARMEQTAAPGTVQISEDTYRLVAPLFEFEPLGEVAVKGKQAPVLAYRPLAPKAKPGRLRGIAGLETRLVGRDAEIAALKRALDGTRSGTGQGTVVCLTGEAGLGKSRLINEARREWDGYWSESRSVSYDTTRPYGQFQQHIRRLCVTNEGDSPDAVRGRIAETIERLLADKAPEFRARAARIFEVLLSVDGAVGIGDAIHLEGKQFKRELFDVMGDIWRSQASQTPSALIFDDLHWADPASVELLLHLFPLTGEAPLLLVCAFRPDEQAASWEVKQHGDALSRDRFHLLELHLLSDKESGALVQGLLDIEELPDALKERIFRRAEGNPFFVEEMVRALIEGGALLRDEEAGWRVADDAGDGASIALPDNLQALLTARIDRLDARARRTLQVAAVIGRTFSQSVLEAVAGDDSHGAQLDTLQAAGMLHEVSSAPEREYAFHHALTQEAAYHTILLKERRLFHSRAGEALEQLYPERVEVYAPLLGHHFYEANDDPRALKYYTLAGDAAANLYANAEAAQHYTRALEVARRARPGAVGSEALAHLYTERGRTLGLTNNYEAALVNYEGMQKLGSERDEPALVLEALMARATLRSTPTPLLDPAQGQTLSDEALALARQLGNRQAEARILWNLLLMHSNTGDYRAGVTAGEQSLALARQLGEPEQLAFTLNDLQRAYVGTGQLDHAQAVLDEAQALWRDLGNLPMLTDNLSGSGYVHFLRGDFSQVLAQSEEAYRIGLKSGSRWAQGFSRTISGLAYMELGEIGEAIEAKQQSLQAAREAGLVHQVLMVRADLGWTFARLGDIEGGLAMGHLALAEAGEHAPPVFHHWAVACVALLEIEAGNLDTAAALIGQVTGDEEAVGPLSLAPILLPLAEGELGLARGQYDQTVTIMDRLLARLRQWGMRTYVTDALTLKGKAHLAQGDLELARAALAEAREAGEAINARRSLVPLLRTLGNLAATSGAEAVRQQASEMIAVMADTIRTDALRSAFLASPYARLPE